MFRCPTTTDDLTISSPSICQSYLQIRSQVVPRLEPYYHDHAEPYLKPYLDSIQPYVSRVNNHVVAPVIVLADKARQQYGLKLLTVAQSLGHDAWTKYGVPIADRVKTEYHHYHGIHIRPLLGHAQLVTQPYVAQLQPWLDKIHVFVLDMYHSKLVPASKQALAYAHQAYEQFLPYARRLHVTTNRALNKVLLPRTLQAYESAFHFTTTTALPRSRQIFLQTWIFVRRRIWYPLRILYGENVEPQLSKIRERLASYRDSKRIEAAVEAVGS